MASLIKKDLLMPNAAGSDIMQVPVINPAFRWINVLNMTENVIYLQLTSSPDTAPALVAFGPYSSLSVPIIPEIADNFRLRWAGTAGIKAASVVFTYDSLGYNECYAPSFAFAGGALNILSNNPLEVVNQPGGQLTVAGAVNIANTPNVNVTSGSVNANIQNAQINTNMVNTSISPGQIQQSVGSYDTPNYINATITTTGTTALLTAGNYITKIYLSINNWSSSDTHTFVIKLGNNPIHTAKLLPGETSNLNLDFSNSGIYNLGINLFSNDTVPHLSVYGVVSTSIITPKPKTSLVS